MSECVEPEHVDAYVNLTDDVILRKIQKSKPGLEKAQRIIASVQQKHFYECVGETEPIPSHQFTKKHPVKEDILANLGAGCDAFSGHVIIQILNFDISKNESNPLEEIRFYNKNEPSRAKTAAAEEALQLLPMKHFSEQIIRVLLKPSEDEGKDRKRKQELEKAFNVWYEKEKKHLKSAP